VIENPRNGATLDEAVQALNAALQQSNDATLKRIVAVKERNDAGSAEGLRFLSTLSEFRVSLGATQQGGGLNGGTATVLTSDELSGGAVTDISNKDNAANAVSLLATAVSLLGTAQASVGKGQNRLQFAVGLAATQINILVDTILASKMGDGPPTWLAITAPTISSASSLFLVKPITNRHSLL